MNKYKMPIIILLCVNILLCTAAVIIFKEDYTSSDLNTTDQPAIPEDTVLAFSTPANSSTPQISKATLKQFLTEALKPVGKTMYVYGGGWNEEDTGAGNSAVTIGLSPLWEDFFILQDSTYDSSKYRYHIEKGLDCSGYIGWVLYNTLETENGRPGYVFLAQELIDHLTDMNFGTKIEHQNIAEYLPGDIAGSDSDCHAWISFGQCSDGSVVLVNSSPPGVRICGTAAPDGTKNSLAVKTASEAMSKYFPQWYEKFPDCVKGASYLHNYDIMRWNLSESNIMYDPENYRSMPPEQILEALLSTDK